MMQLFKYFKSHISITILLVYLFLASGIIVNILQFLTWMLWYIGYKNAYRKIISALNYINWCWILFVSQWWANIEVYHYTTPEGFEKSGKENALVIQNHKSQLDWVLSYVVADSADILGNCKCIMKKIARFIPIFGFSHWSGESIFIKRKIEEDRKTLKEGFEAYSTYTDNFLLLMFCEGTRFTPARHERSQQFALQNGLKPLKHHLVPKSKGFVLATREMGKSVDAIYDATLCIRGKKDPTFLSMLQGKPCIADFIVRRVPIDEIPTGDAECVQYLRDMYYEKDRLFEYHQLHGVFPVGEEHEKYEDYIKKRISKKYLPLFVVSFWFVVCLGPLFYFVYATLSSGSSQLRIILAALLLSVVIIFQLFMKVLTPKST